MSSSNPFGQTPFLIWFRFNEDELKRDFAKESIIFSEGVHWEECDECHGDGWVACNMGHDHECGRCEGSGRLNEESKFMKFAMSEYRIRLTVDHRKAVEYQKFMEAYHASGESVNRGEAVGSC